MSLAGWGALAGLAKGLGNYVDRQNALEDKALEEALREAREKRVLEWRRDENDRVYKRNRQDALDDAERERGQKLKDEERKRGQALKDYEAKKAIDQKYAKPDKPEKPQVVDLMDTKSGQPFKAQVYADGRVVPMGRTESVAVPHELGPDEVFDALDAAQMDRRALADEETRFRPYAPYKAGGEDQKLYKLNEPAPGEAQRYGTRAQALAGGGPSDGDYEAALARAEKEAESRDPVGPNWLRSDEALAKAYDGLTREEWITRRALQIVQEAGGSAADGRIGRALARPRIGQEVNGYRFTGGNPKDPDSWERISE